MEDYIVGMFAIACIFVILPWIAMHYSSQWKRARGISIEDENLLDDLHDTARRLDSRLDSIERIIAADNPGWKEGALPGARPTDRLADAAEPRLSIRR